MSGRPARLGELRDELGRAHDRPRDQVREEGHEQRVVEEILRRLGPPQIDVERVGQGREGVEADPDRQDDVPLRRLVGDPRGRGERDEIFEQELAIFEIAEHPEIDDDGDQHPRPAGRFLLGPHHPLRRPPVDHGRNPQQDHERRVPRRVEQIGCEQQVDLLLLPRKKAALCIARTSAKNTTNVSELKIIGRPHGGRPQYCACVASPKRHALPAGPGVAALGRLLKVARSTRAVGPGSALRFARDRRVGVQGLDHVEALDQHISDNRSGAARTTPSVPNSVPNPISENNRTTPGRSTAYCWTNGVSTLPSNCCTTK